MKLYIRQKIFSWRDKYQIWNESGTPVYFVEGEFFSFGAKLHLLDKTGAELYRIEQQIFRFMPEYHIYKGDTLCAVVKKKFMLFGHAIDIDSDFGQFAIDGNFWGMDFTNSTNGVVIGAISKEWFNFADCYELDIASETDPGFFTTLVIAIDHCIHNESNS